MGRSSLPKGYWAERVKAFMKPQVGIVMGSDSDLATMEEAGSILEKFEIEYEMKILSAHRTPELAAEYAKTAADRGIRVIIAGAGMANHLGGAMAAHTILPVIGVPLDASPLKGLDALMSTVQMPAGVPVACVAVGKAGAKNGGFLAAQILALSDEKLQLKLQKTREENKKKIIDKNKELEKK